MNILIVEDQKEKSEDIQLFLDQCINVDIDYVVCQSLRSGLRQLLSGTDFSVIILDMSMPNFDPSPDDPIGGTPESFAGKEFLAQMDLRDIAIPVVVVTQYTTFAKGRIDLEDLDLLFKHSYSGFYLGSVFYSSADDTWKNQLKELLKGILFNE